MLQLANVTKRYASTVAVDSVSITFAPATTTAIIGASGCGKSTLLRLMIGLVSPDAGVVSVDDVTINAANSLQIRRKIGYVIQEGGLFPHLTARRNVTLLARYLRWPQQRIDERLDELSELTHFPTDGFDRYPGQLSGGQRQRLGLMRALMLDPTVLLLDEPLGALDPMIRSRLQDELREIFRTLHKTVVLVTHDLTEAAYLADTIVLMNAGRVVQQGSLRSLTEQPADSFVTTFLGAQRCPIELPGAST